VPLEGRRLEGVQGGQRIPLLAVVQPEDAQELAQRGGVQSTG
jgi:hypothetical protein